MTYICKLLGHKMVEDTNAPFWKFGPPWARKGIFEPLSKRVAENLYLSYMGRDVENMWGDNAEPRGIVDKVKKEDRVKCARCGFRPWGPIKQTQEKEDGI